MQIAAVKPGDLVMCERSGWRFIAEVTGKDQGKLQVEPFQRSCTYREVTSRQVIAHYRKAKNSQI